MGVIKFQTIWDNYPNYDPCRNVKTGEIPEGYENQCAMRVGYALEKSGISFRSFKGGRCPLGPRTGGMVASAQELANWLRARPFPGCPKPEHHTGKAVFDGIKDRSGIIFLADYWQRSSDKGNARTGDHIDLWNGSRMTSIWSWPRIHLYISWDGVWSDLRGAPKVLFWPVS